MADAADHKFKTAPYAHQLECFELSRNHEHFALLMEMGTGKSKVLVDTAAWLFGRGSINALLVTAPKSVTGTWATEQLPAHLPDSVSHPLVVVWSPTPTKKKQELYARLFTPDPLCLKVLVMNIEALSTQRGKLFAEAFLRAHHALWAVDESTGIKNPTAKRTRAVLKLAPLARYRRILTGMPVTQSPLDVFCQYEFLRSGLLDSSNYFAFKHRYAVLRRRVINGRSFDEVVGYQRLDELQRLVLAHGYRKLKSECLDLPEKIYQTRQVGLGEEQRRAYEELRDRAVFELSQAQRVTAPLVITQLLRLRQALSGRLVADDGSTVELGATPRLDELLAVCAETSGKVIVWCSFVDSIHRVTEALLNAFGEGSAARFFGDVPADARQCVVDRFQDPVDPLRFFVGQVRTGGFGITLTAADTVVYYEHEWSLEARAQSEDRAHRIGQRRSVTYVDLVAPGTVDELIVQALRDKKELADLVTGDGWRELFVKKEI